MLRIRDLITVDIDEWLSYLTEKEIMVRNRYFGLLYWACNIVVFFYILVFSIIIGGGCYISEDSIGAATLIKSYGGSIGYSILPDGSLNKTNFDYYDSTQLLQSPDPSTFTVPIKIKKIYGQTNKCQGVSKVDLGWCANPNLTNSTQEYYIPEYEAVLVTFQSVMRFPQLSSSLIYTLNQEKNMNLRIRQPAQNANTYSISEIFQMAGVTISPQTQGGTIQLNYQWKCTVPGTCLPTLKAAFVDRTNVQDSYRYYHTIRGGNLYRDKSVVTGYKILLSAQGSGKSFSIIQGVMMLSLGIPFFLLVPILVDIVMMFCSSNRSEYRKLKFKWGDDLKLEEKPEEDQRQKQRPEDADEVHNLNISFD